MRIDVSRNKPGGFMKRFLTIAAITAFSLAASAQQASMQRSSLPTESVTVSGNGRSVVAPDRFTFTVGVQTMGATVDAAVSENNKRTAAVIAALKAAGAKQEDIQTANFNIWPQQDYQEGRLPRILGYQVMNNVTVRSTKIADAGRLLGVAIGAGVNTSSGINFEVANPATGRDQGMRSAFEDARAKAAALASAAGRTLGRAFIISEGSQQYQPTPPPYARAMAMEAKAVSDVPVEAGTQEQMYTVTVTFELM
jgi:uncharacterized protein YggE